VPFSTRNRLMFAAGIPTTIALAQFARIVSSNVTNRHHCPHSEKACFIGCFDGRLNFDHARRLTGVDSLRRLIFTHDFSARFAGGAARLLTESDRDFVLGEIFVADDVSQTRGCDLEEVNLFVHLGCIMLESLTAPGAELAEYDATTVEGLFIVLHDARLVVLAEWNRRFPGRPIKVNAYVTSIGLSPLGLPKTFTVEYKDSVHA
jgi:hypothetical protein